MKQFFKKRMSFEDWYIPGYDYDANKKHSNTVFVAFDTEYQSNVQTAIDIGGRKQDVNQRRMEDIISLQVAINYCNKRPVQYFLHREPSDDVFIFDDIIKLVKEYLKDIGVYNDVKKDIGNNVFNVELWAFFSGVDLTALGDWDKVLTEYSKDKSKGSNLVTIHSNTVFTSKPLNLIVKDRQRHLDNLFPKMRLVIRDMTKLAPGKLNLAGLGEIVNVPKLDTEKLDKQDNLPIGYYKSHMTELWHNHRDFFIQYAMRDAVITALYGSFVLKFQDGLANDGLGDFKPSKLKSSLSSIVANIAGLRNEQPSDWIIDQVYEMIQENVKNHGTKYDLMSFLKPICKFKDPNKIDESFKDLFDNLNAAKDWLHEHLDFDLIRKGYSFPRYDKSKDNHHKHLVNDITNRDDAPQAMHFNDANKAYYGGYNVCHYPSMLPAGWFKRDYDLKSAYNTVGHLIPDIAPGLGVMHKKMLNNIPANKFKDIVDWAEQLNGPYTIGVGVFSIEYPENYKGFVITPKSVNDGPRYFRKIEETHLMYTDAYAAYLCGARVFTHRLSFPYQATINPTKQKGVCEEGRVQDIFQKRRSRYPKSNPLNDFNKAAGNVMYGTSGEGLKEKKSKDFNNYKSYFIPFSRITNPFKAAEYTAVTRLHILILQQSILKVDSKAMFLNNVTDGSLVATEKPLDADKITAEMRKLTDWRYQEVVDNYFNGCYFEEKDGSDKEVANIKTRLTFSDDGNLKAMVGINANKLSPQDVFKQYLNKNAIKIPVQNRVITGLNDMRHVKKFKHLQTSWDDESDLYLGYDFAQLPTRYVNHGQYCYWETRPYLDQDEFEKYWWFGRDLIKYGPFYTSEYAPYFKQMLDQYDGTNLPKKFGEFGLKEYNDADYQVNSKLKRPRKATELYENWAVYVGRNHLDVSQSYDTLMSTINNLGWDFYTANGQIKNAPTLRSFTKLGKDNIDKNIIVNVVLLHYVNLI